MMCSSLDIKLYSRLKLSHFVADATVCFEPLRYQVIEGGSVTLTLVTDVVVQKNFSIMVTTVDGSAISEYTTVFYL